MRKHCWKQHSTHPSLRLLLAAAAGINSIDSLCARHALALAALLARDNPAMYSEQVARLLAGNLEIFQSTGGWRCRVQPPHATTWLTFSVLWFLGVWVDCPAGRMIHG